MERLLGRLERRFGRYAVQNLILFVVGGTAIVWALALSKPEFEWRLMLDWHAVRRGELWRLVTFVFIPPPVSGIWLLFYLYFTWWVGSSLEQHWGAFKFDVYYLAGTVAMIAASAVAGRMTNTWIGGSNVGLLALAFATVFPDVEIYVLLFIPVRAKWLGLLGAVWLAYMFATGGFATRAGIVAEAATYALFFGSHWSGVLRDRGVVARQQARRASMESSSPPVFGKRQCALCGAREADGADIRVCSCEKCGGSPRMLCLEHARKH